MQGIRVAGAFHGPQYCLATAAGTDASLYEGVAFGHRENIEIVRHLAISPDGRRLVAAGIGLVVRSWTYSYHPAQGPDGQWTPEASVQFDEDPQSPVCWLSIVGLAFADPEDDRSAVVAVRSDGLVEWWDPSDLASRPARHRVTLAPVTAALLAAPYLCTGHWDGTVGVYTMHAGEQRIRVTSESRFRLLVRLDAQAHVPARSCGTAARLTDAYRCVRALVASSSSSDGTGDGRILSVGGLDNVVRRWALPGADGGRVRFLDELPCPPDSQGILCLAQRGPYIVAGCTAGVLVWAREDGRTWKLWCPHDPDHISAYRNLVTSVRISDDGLHIVTSGPHQRTRTTVWSTETGRPVGHLFGRGMCATALVLLPPLVTHGEALQAIEDISLATGLLPDVSELVFKFLFSEHAGAYLAHDYYAQGRAAVAEI